MKEIVLIIGGCRSGKSRRALEEAEARAGRRNLFLATCLPHDDEMRERVRRHQAERSALWTTVEAPHHLSAALREHGPKADVVLVDCLTLWLGNLVVEAEDPTAVDMAGERLLLALEAARCPVYLVTNEVGAGIVPENALARHFRDACGFLNQRVAAAADRVVWMVAGIPVTVKAGEPRP
jgi:adenosylcobinamide kinase/adenosylcobinamide-phosphate guanylyltransferase